jgi:hypothetical protein
MLLLVMLLITIVVGIFFLLKSRKGYHSNEGWAGIFIIQCFISLIVVFYSGVAYFNNLGEAVRLETFYNSNSSLYISTIDSTQSLLTNDKLVEYLINGNIEKIGLGESISNRIAEYRDIVAKYNTDLASYKKFSSNFWISYMYPKLQDDIKCISFTD